MAHLVQVEIDRNYDFFQRNLGSYLEENAGRYALLRHEKVVSFLDTVMDAEALGESKFDDGLYSIQEVTDTPVDLGFFSHAFDNGIAA